MLTIGVVLLALGVVGLLALVAGWRPGVEPWRGDRLETSISPDGLWEARAYELNPGAMAHEHMRVEVRDLDDPEAAARTIYLEDGLGSLSWSDADTLVVTSYATNERRELDVTTADEVSVGPDPSSKDSLDELVWLVVFGPASLLLAVLGVLLVVAGRSLGARRAMSGARGSRAAQGSGE